MRCCSILGGIGFALVPLTGAHAANGLRPRTPAVFADVPCVQTVAPGDVLHIEYAVPYDDVELTPDELLDSRQHQFFAFNRQRFDFALPVWINQRDFDRADANGDITKDFSSQDILETSSSWPASAWVPITGDEPRLPITMEQAALGFDWDTADVSPGTWMIAAYTWEPENNLWSHRFGAVRVVDPDDPASAGPSAFLEYRENVLATAGEAIEIPGCVEASPGSVFTAWWGKIEGVDEPEWVPFVEDEPAPSGTLSLAFTPPAEAGSSVKIRIEVRDPEGRSFVAYTPAVLGVQHPTQGTDGGSASDSDGEPGDTDGSGGVDAEAVGCSVAPSPGPSLLFLVLGAAFFRREPR